MHVYQDSKNVPMSQLMFFVLVFACKVFSISCISCLVSLRRDFKIWILPHLILNSYVYRVTRTLSPPWGRHIYVPQQKSKLKALKEHVSRYFWWEILVVAFVVWPLQFFLYDKLGWNVLKFWRFALK